ncbi:MAG: aminopeptidase P N-terminal domain-containing protein, partial [Gemmatimonadetes bacterium]|nr:aminopeptidase P N-terminal domain-containing protein [Gemmatimonadota bacterium]
SDQVLHQVATCGVTHPTGTGLFGGIPGPPNTYRFRTGNGSAGDVVLRAERLDPADERTRELSPKESNLVQRPGDVYEVSCAGAAGLGDPLARDPASVERDVADGRYTPAVAERLFGVVIDAAGKVDPEAAEERRGRARAERLSAATAGTPYDGPPVERLLRAITETLDVGRAADGSLVLCSTYSGEPLCSVDGAYKDACARLVVPVQEATPLGEDPSQFIDATMEFRMYLCPRTGGIIETEVARAEDPPLHELELDAASVDSSGYFALRAAEGFASASTYFHVQDPAKSGFTGRQPRERALARPRRRAGLIGGLLGWADPAVAAAFHSPPILGAAERLAIVCRRVLERLSDAELGERLAARTLELIDIPSVSRDEAALAAALPGDGVVVAVGEREPTADYLSFHQRSPFRYLTGFEEPNAYLVMVRRGGALSATLFVQPGDAAREVLTERFRIGQRAVRTRHPVEDLLDLGAERRQLGGEAIAGVDDRGVGGGVVRQRAVRAHGLLAIAAVDRRVGMDREGRDVRRQPLVHPPHGCDVRIARGVVRGDQIDAKRVLVAVAEDPPVVVHRDAPLPLGRGPPQLELPIHQSVLAGVLRAVQPVVHPPEEAVGVVLDVAARVPVVGAHQLARVRPQVAARVAGEPDVRGRREERSVTVEHLQRTWQDEAVDEDGPLVHATIIVEILEHRDPADRRVGSLVSDVGHVAAHLHDPHAPLRVELDPHRLLYQWLRRDQLHPISFGEAEGLQRLLRRQHRRDLRSARELHGRQRRQSDSLLSAAGGRAGQQRNRPEQPNEFECHASWRWSMTTRRLGKGRAKQSLVAARPGSRPAPEAAAVVGSDGVHPTKGTRCAGVEQCLRRRGNQRGGRGALGSTRGARTLLAISTRPVQIAGEIPPTQVFPDPGRGRDHWFWNGGRIRRGSTRPVLGAPRPGRRAERKEIPLFRSSSAAATFFPQYLPESDGYR